MHREEAGAAGHVVASIGADREIDIDALVSIALRVASEKPNSVHVRRRLRGQARILANCASARYISASGSKIDTLLTLC